MQPREDEGNVRSQPGDGLEVFRPGGGDRPGNLRQAAGLDPVSQSLFVDEVRTRHGFRCRSSRVRIREAETGRRYGQRFEAFLDRKNGGSRSRETSEIAPRLTGFSRIRLQKMLRGVAVMGVVNSPAGF